MLMDGGDAVEEVVPGLIVDSLIGVHGVRVVKLVVFSPAVNVDVEF